MQVSVSSIAKARELVNSHPQLESILVGGKQYKPLSTDELQSVFVLLDHEQESIEDVSNTGGIFVRSVFLPKHGHNGTLYRVGEFCLICNSMGEQAVVKISDIFTISLNNTYFSFIKGHRYTPDAVNPVTHPYSGNPIVAEAQIQLMCSASQIERKVMLYPHQTLPDQFIVMDYNRQSIPLAPADVVIPLLPEKNDVIKVHGEDDNTWLAHVRDVHVPSKTCRVQFYIEHVGGTNIYRGETTRIETVHWDSIVDLSSGRWLSSSQYQADNN